MPGEAVSEQEVAATGQAVSEFEKVWEFDRSAVNRCPDEKCKTPWSVGKLPRGLVLQVKCHRCKEFFVVRVA